MKKYQSRNSSIHIIARGLLFQGEKVILCHVKDKDWFFLPGGHVEDGESVRMALFRELNEEIGEAEYKITSFLGVCENVFSLSEDAFQHEINIVFKVEVPKNFVVSTKEDHIEFKVIDKEELTNYKILPDKLKSGLLDWIIYDKPFIKEI
jgi:ADP-ribose pyrophosphatase YjhB (NUDIX family)